MKALTPPPYRILIVSRFQVILFYFGFLRTKDYVWSAVIFEFRNLKTPIWATTTKNTNRNAAWCTINVGTIGPHIQEKYRTVEYGAFSGFENNENCHFYDQKTKNPFFEFEMRRGALLLLDHCAAYTRKI